MKTRKTENILIGAYVALFLAAIMGLGIFAISTAQEDAAAYRYETERVEATVTNVAWHQYHRGFAGWRVNADVSAKDDKYGCDTSRIWRNYPSSSMTQIIRMKEGDKIQVIVKTKYSRETGEVVQRWAEF